MIKDIITPSLGKVVWLAAGALLLPKLISIVKR